MILLDSDHLSVLRYPENPRCAGLRDRLDSAPDQRLATTIISVEEQMRGWLAAIGRLRKVEQQVPVYDQLRGLFDFFQEWEIVPFDFAAAAECKRLRKQRVRIGTPDLKISAIVVVQNALLLSADQRDFGQVPDLRVENWLE